jgi:hypothetical protein
MYELSAQGFDGFGAFKCERYSLRGCNFNWNYVYGYVQTRVF